MHREETLEKRSNHNFLSFFRRYSWLFLLLQLQACKEKVPPRDQTNLNFTALFDSLKSGREDSMAARRTINQFIPDQEQKAFWVDYRKYNSKLDTLLSYFPVAEFQSFLDSLDVKLDMNLLKSGYRILPKELPPPDSTQGTYGRLAIDYKKILLNPQVLTTKDTLGTIDTEVHELAHLFACRDKDVSYFSVLNEGGATLVSVNFIRDYLRSKKENEDWVYQQMFNINFPYPEKNMIVGLIAGVIGKKNFLSIYLSGHLVVENLRIELVKKLGAEAKFLIDTLLSERSTPLDALRVLQFIRKHYGEEGFRKIYREIFGDWVPELTTREMGIVGWYKNVVFLSKAEMGLHGATGSYVILTPGGKLIETQYTKGGIRSLERLRVLIREKLLHENRIEISVHDSLLFVSDEDFMDYLNTM